MRLSVIGAGYVGLVSAVCLADRGYEVILSTEDPQKAKLINQGMPPFHETGLEEALKRTVQSGKLRVNIGREDAILNSDITFIAVGTPSKADESINLTYIKDSGVNIGKVLLQKTGYHLVVVRSTVVPGTTENKIKPAIEKHSGKAAGKDFGLVMQPEFLRQGSAIYDTLNPDRIIIGEYDSKSGETLENLYRGFYKEKLPPTLHMNIASAEMIKYASNAFLATKISFINEIADLCETVPDIDVAKVAEGMGLDERIGKRFLHAGPGFGGSCFPKDVNALVAFAKSRRYTPRILESTLKVNENQADHVVEMARRQLKTLKDRRIAVLGLSFKPGTDDLREAPSLKIIRRLLHEHAKIVAYDPVSMKNTRRILGNRIEYAESAQSCLKGTDVALIVTEWEEFKTLSPTTFCELMRRSIVIDCRRIYEAEKFLEHGIKFSAIGLGPRTAVAKK